MGASTTLERKTCDPILMVIASVCGAASRGACDLVIGAAQAHVDLEPFGVLAGIQDVESRIDSLSGREHAHRRLAEIFRRLELAGADSTAEAVGERDSQQRIRLQLRRRVEYARAHPQRTFGARIAGYAPLAKLIGGEIRGRGHAPSADSLR